MLSLPNDPDRRPETEEAELHVIRSANRLRFCFERLRSSFRYETLEFERDFNSMHLRIRILQLPSKVCAINKLEQRHSTMRTALNANLKGNSLGGFVFAGDVGKHQSAANQPLYEAS